MAFSRLRSGICVANLHASQAPAAAERELHAAAANAVRWAGADPLILGGDLNLRPATSPLAFTTLSAEYGFSEPGERDSIDHLLARGLEPVEPPAGWAVEDRELPDPTAAPGDRALAVRLSDHAPVAAAFAPPG